MVFSSLIFLWVFLPVTLGGYFLIPKKYKNIFLLLDSLIFYAWGGGEIYCSAVDFHLSQLCDWTIDGKVLWHKKTAFAF